MSANFSANQYQNAFIPKKIQNWEVPKNYQEEPRKLGGTKIIANDDGYLLPEYKRSDTKTWSNFVGTWDMPKKLPGTKIDIRTARDPVAFEKLQKEFQEPRDILSGKKSTKFCSNGEASQSNPISSKRAMEQEERPRSNASLRATPQCSSRIEGNQTDRSINDEQARQDCNEFGCVAAL